MISILPHIDNPDSYKEDFKNILYTLQNEFDDDSYIQNITKDILSLVDQWFDERNEEIDPKSEEDEEQAFLDQSKEDQAIQRSIERSIFDDVDQ